MAVWIKVARVSEIAEGAAKCVEAGGRSIALFNLGGELHAIDDECSHVGGPLSGGEIRGEEVECPWHGACFNIKTGAAVAGPASGDVERYDVRIEGDDVAVEV